MELSAEERRKIYEEEKARLEAETKGIRKEDTLENAGSGSARVRRITASSLAIAWSIAVLLLFYIFQHYLAYYHIEQVNGVDTWARSEILTGGFITWLPLLTATLVLTIIGHVVAIIYDRYIVRQSIITGLNILGVATVAYLVALFPFDFTPVPDGEIIFSAVLHIILAIILIILGIITLINLVKLIVRVATKTATY